ncbi:MAG: N-acetylmuramyl-L-alanine amidase, negative regulator of AmpC, AmpD [bacterium]|nr:N-acetylmuramyl-L-alanine amidase, negative regulator of AmpC, AmpD [bacterium]
MAGSSIIICGQRFDVGQKVVTFEDDPGISAYTPHRTDKPSEIPPFAPAKGMAGIRDRWRPRRLIGSDRSIERLRQVVRQFVVHHDGCQDSRTCFQVLHNERGLSVHFLIDNDGTIFQTLDLVDCAFQAAGVNEISVGVELANRGDAMRFPNDYHGKRDKVTCRINGHQFLAYAYTQAQMASMISIGKTLARLFPNLPQVYPNAGGDAEPMWATLRGDVREYTGYLGHYHVTDQKWDPGPFDFKFFASKIRGRMVFPVAIGANKPDVPDEPEKAEEIANSLFDNNETEGEGGYFPVGPYGQSRLWHGGVHLRADKGTPVYAPFSGKLVAARMTEDGPVGSRNFVLIRSDLPVGSAQLRFWTLLFHLDLETATTGKDVPAWFTKAAGQLGEDPVALSIDVNAGDLVGHVGEAGLPGRTDGQLHVEVMSGEELGEKVDPGFWTLVEGAGMGRFCEAPDIVGRIDKPSSSGPGQGKKDGLLSRAEVLNFFKADPQREGFRKLAVHHISEWADNNDWQVALNRTRDFAELPKAQKARLFRDQIEPVLWWTDEIAEAAELPSDKLVWNYHPVTFIVWLHDKLRGARATAKDIAGESAFEGKAAPTNIKDDGEATEGFTDDEDVLFGDAGRKLELEDLAMGYPDDKEKM